LRRNNRFIWTRECEEAFLKLKEYLVSPQVLCKPLLGTPLRLYFTVTERAISSVLVQEQDQVQKPIYFVSKVLQGRRYQALEKAALAVVFSARRLRHYFQSFTVLATVIQETLKTPQTFTADNLVEVHQVSTSRGGKRSHRSLTQETLRMPRISTYPVLGEEALQVCLVEGGET